jgi:hypothetical protein
MAKLYGITTTQIIPQPDFSARGSDNGGITATQSFWVRNGALASTVVLNKFVSGATLLSLDPNCEKNYERLLLTKALSVSSVEGGYVNLEMEFNGFGSGSFDNESAVIPVPTYSKRGVLYEAPLDEHHKWKSLDDTDKFALGLLINGSAVCSPDFTGVGSYGEAGTWAAWEDDSGPIVLSGDALEFAKRIAQGKVTFKAASYEYTHRWESNSGVSAATMNDLGKISTPSGSPPTPGTGRNWLMVGVNEEQAGAGNYRFTNELVYLLSEEGGHDSFLQD